MAHTALASLLLAAVAPASNWCYLLLSLMFMALIMLLTAALVFSAPFRDWVLKGTPGEITLGKFSLRGVPLLIIYAMFIGGLRYTVKVSIDTTNAAVRDAAVAGDRAREAQDRVAENVAVAESMKAAAEAVSPTGEVTPVKKVEVVPVTQPSPPDGGATAPGAAPEPAASAGSGAKLAEVPAPRGTSMENVKELSRLTNEALRKAEAAGVTESQDLQVRAVLQDGTRVTLPTKALQAVAQQAAPQKAAPAPASTTRPAARRR